MCGRNFASNSILFSKYTPPSRSDLFVSMPGTFIRMRPPAVKCTSFSSLPPFPVSSEVHDSSIHPARFQSGLRCWCGQRTYSMTYAISEYPRYRARQGSQIRIKRGGQDSKPQPVCTDAKRDGRCRKEQGRGRASARRRHRMTSAGAVAQQGLFTAIPLSFPQQAPVDTVYKARHVPDHPSRLFLSPLTRADTTALEPECLTGSVAPLFCNGHAPERMIGLDQLADLLVSSNKDTAAATAAHKEVADTVVVEGTVALPGTARAEDLAREALLR